MCSPLVVDVIALSVSVTAKWGLLRTVLGESCCNYNYTIFGKQMIGYSKQVVNFCIFARVSRSMHSTSSFSVLFQKNVL